MFLDRMRLLAGRLVAAVPLLFFASVGAFLLIHLTPGDPAAIAVPEGATHQQLEEARHALGLDQPLLVQYLSWVRHAAAGNLGTSFQNGRPVATLIAERLPVTLSLALMATAFSVPIALFLGTLAGAFEGRPVDRLVTAFSSLGLAMPSFWVGLLLAYAFAIRNRWLPATGWVPFTDDPWAWFTHLVLPAFTLAVGTSAQLTRQLRGSMADVMSTDYIRAAEAKGLGPVMILGKHGLKNAAIPVVTLLGLQLIALLGGAVIVEAVFALPGLGTLIITAVVNRDIPVIQGVVLVIAVVAVVVNLLVDLTYGWLNPRVRVA
jgi:peptide/nickel transport system permease protein